MAVFLYEFILHPKTFDAASLSCLLFTDIGAFYPRQLGRGRSWFSLSLRTLKIPVSVVFFTEKKRLFRTLYARLLEKVKRAEG